MKNENSPAHEVRTQVRSRWQRSDEEEASHATCTCACATEHLPSATTGAEHAAEAPEWNPNPNSNPNPSPNAGPSPSPSSPSQNPNPNQRESVKETSSAREMADAGGVEEMGEITLLERSYTATALREGEDRPEREWDVAAEVEEIRQLERVFVEAAVSAATRAARAARAATPASVALAAAWAAAAEAAATAAAAVAAATAEASSAWPARRQMGLVGRPHTARPNPRQR